MSNRPYSDAIGLVRPMPLTDEPSCYNPVRDPNDDEKLVEEAFAAGWPLQELSCMDRWVDVSKAEFEWGRRAFRIKPEFLSGCELSFVESARPMACKHCYRQLTWGDMCELRICGACFSERFHEGATEPKRDLFNSAGVARENALYAHQRGRRR